MAAMDWFMFDIWLKWCCPNFRQRDSHGVKQALLQRFLFFFFKWPSPFYVKSWLVCSMSWCFVLSCGVFCFPPFLPHCTTPPGSGLSSQVNIQLSIHQWQLLVPASVLWQWRFLPFWHDFLYLKCSTPSNLFTVCSLHWLLSDALGGHWSLNLICSHLCKMPVSSLLSLMCPLVE